MKVENIKSISEHLEIP